MARIKYNVARKKRVKKILKAAKGQWGDRSKRLKHARESLLHSMTYAYRDRRTKKREFRKLWTVRINAAAREAGLTYSRFINGLKKAKVSLDRKILADLAIKDSAAFNKLIEIAKS